MSSRFVFRGTNGFGFHSVRVSGDLKAEPDDKYAFGLVEVDGRSVVFSDTEKRWGLADRAGNFTLLNSAEASPENPRGWLSFSPDGKRALLARNGRVTLWDRRTLKLRELEMGVDVFFNSYRFLVAWIHGGFLLFGSFGAVFFDASGKRTVAGPEFKGRPIQLINAAEAVGKTCKTTGNILANR